MIQHRHRSFFVRALLLAVVSAAASACYFDGHWGGCHSHFRSCAPIRVCR